MSDSIKNKAIWRLTNGRKLSDGEIRELDALQIALDLDENDPFWGQVAWIWATTPRKTDFDVAVQAICDKIKEAHDLSATFKGDGGLSEVNKKLDDLVSRPVPGAVPAPMAMTAKIDEAALSKVLTAVIQAHGGTHAHVDFIRQFKDAVREGVSWVWVGLAGVGFALALVLGYVGGETMQGHDDGPRIQALQGQVSTLTAVVAGRHR